MLHWPRFTCTKPSGDHDTYFYSVSANCTVPLCFVVCSFLSSWCDVDAVLTCPFFVSMDTVAARYAHLWSLSHSDRNGSRFAVFQQKTDKVTLPITSAHAVIALSLSAVSVSRFVVTIVICERGHCTQLHGWTSAVVTAHQHVGRSCCTRRLNHCVVTLGSQIRFSSFFRTGENSGRHLLGMDLRVVRFAPDIHITPVKPGVLGKVHGSFMRVLANSLCHLWMVGAACILPVSDRACSGHCSLQLEGFLRCGSSSKCSPWYTGF